LITSQEGPKIEGSSSVRRSMRGLIWLSGSRVFSQVASLIITTILARLLTPTDYGLIGMAMVIMGFLALFTDFGTGMAVVQHENLREEQLSSIFWLNIAIGLSFCVLLIAISPLAASFYGEPILILMISVMAIGFPVASLRVVHESLFRRRLEFDIIVKSNVVATTSAGLIGIGAALLGWGVWALVAQHLAQSLVSTGILWISSPWRPKLRFASADIRQIAGFSGNLMGFNIVNYFARNADYLLIGRVLGTVPLGLYTLAYRLMLYPISNISGVMVQALFPAFSRMQSDPKRLSHAYIRACKYLALLTFPLMAGMSLMAGEVIIVVFGPNWVDATTTLRVLALVGLFQPLVSLYGSVILALGYSSWYFRWGLIISAVMCISFAIGLPWGINGVATSYLLAQIITTIVGIPILFRKGDTPLVSFLSNLRVPVVATGFMSAVVLATRWALIYYTTVSDLQILIFCTIAGVATYAAVLWLQGDSWRRAVHQDMRLVIGRKSSQTV
jgi:O-antigen/teichoic acid export membrane protein